MMVEGRNCMSATSSWCPPARPDSALQSITGMKPLSSFHSTLSRSLFSFLWPGRKHSSTTSQMVPH